MDRRGLADCAGDDDGAHMEPPTNCRPNDWWWANDNADATAPFQSARSQSINRTRRFVYRGRQRISGAQFSATGLLLRACGMQQKKRERNV